MSVFGRVLHDSGCERVEMDIRNRLSEVVFRVEETGAVSTLQEPAKVLVTIVVVPGDVRLQARHRVPKRNGPSLDDQVVVIAHQNPGQDSPVVGISGSSDGFNEFIGLEPVIKDELSARDAAIDVVNRSRNKEAGMSRHEIPLMRGRDAAILLRQL